MTRIEYDLLREQEPQLMLPHWYRLRLEWRARAMQLDRESLISGRMAKLLAEESPLHYAAFCEPREFAMSKL